MNRPNASLPPDDWMDERVEAYVDDALPPDEAMRFSAALDASPHWRAQVRHAERIHQTLEATELPACPPACTEAILDQTVRAASARTARAARESPQDAPASWLDRVARAFEALSKPAYSSMATTAVGALLVAAVAWMLLAEPFTTGTEHTPVADAPIEAPYTDADVAQAQAEAEWVLAYISDVSQEAGTRAEREMERAFRPLRDASSSPDTP